MTLVPGRESRGHTEAGQCRRPGGGGGGGGGAGGGGGGGGHSQSDYKPNTSGLAPSQLQGQHVGSKNAHPVTSAPPSHPPPPPPSLALPLPHSFPSLTCFLLPHSRTAGCSPLDSSPFGFVETRKVDQGLTTDLRSVGSSVGLLGKNLLSR